MLILTRRVGESIVVGDDIVLTVFEVRGDAVRVGIEAPRSVQVHRQEVYDELKRQNERAVSPSDAAIDALSEDSRPAPVVAVVPEGAASSETGAGSTEDAEPPGPREVSELPRPRPPRPGAARPAGAKPPRER